jgi:hypothetical protein
MKWKCQVQSQWTNPRRIAHFFQIHYRIGVHFEKKQKLSTWSLRQHLQHKGIAETCRDHQDKEGRWQNLWVFLLRLTADLHAFSLFCTWAAVITWWTLITLTKQPSVISSCCMMPISMPVWTCSIGAAGSVCRTPTAHRRRRWLHDRMNRARSALCSQCILSLSLFHRLIMTMFISHKSPCTEDSRRALGCGDWEIPPAFPSSLQETQPETHLTSIYVGLSWDLEHRCHKYHFRDEQRKWDM